MYHRSQNFIHSEKNSFFLWGARQTGKSTLLKYRYPDSLIFDFLMNDVFQRFQRNPSVLREIVLAEKPTEPVIIDEIQKLPALLDEIHWLIENTETQFILSGSSPRKILKQGVNLLGGRALRYELYPLSSTEIPEFNLNKALNSGLIPRHYDAENYEILLAAYVGSYLEDEIIAETKIRNAQIFSKFLEKAAFSNGEILNYSNIATDCGVSSPVIKEYFNILTETMIGRYVEAFRKKPKRRILSSPKFYFFDIGIVNFLLKRKEITFGNEIFGKAFEHFIYHEIATHSHYSGKNYQIRFWRTVNHVEVDFVLGDHEVAIEVKSSNNIQARHLKGLKAFSDEYTVKHKLIVSTEPFPRLVGDIFILPWRVFIKKLWDSEFI